MDRQTWDPSKVQELLLKLVRVCSKSSETALLFHDHLITESGEFIPSLKKASAQTVPKNAVINTSLEGLVAMYLEVECFGSRRSSSSSIEKRAVSALMQLLQEQRVLLAASPYPQKLMERIERLKDGGVQGIDRFIWLMGQIIADPDVKKVVSAELNTETSAPLHSQAALKDIQSSFTGPPEKASRPVCMVDVAHRIFKLGAVAEMQEAATLCFDGLVLDERNQNEMLGVVRPLIGGVSYPGTPQWDLDRPYLTGKHLYQQDILNPTPSTNLSRRESLGKELISNAEANQSLGGYSPAVQELRIVNDLLFMMVGIEGNYIRIRRGRRKGTSFALSVDSTVDSSIQELAKHLLPLCANYLAVSGFAEAQSHFKFGLVNHAFAAALRAILHDYYAMVAQLDHQFRLSRLSLQGLWFFCQPMMGVMQALAAVVQKALVRNLSGAAALNLLQSQAKAMAGDTSGRVLLQKLTQAASIPYFGMLERWVFEGVIDDPYGEFLIDENKVLQKESLSQDYHATYWHQRYSLRDDVPDFLSGYTSTILTAGKYLNAARECGWSVKIPFLNDRHLAVAGTSRPYLERINIAYNHASAELLDLIVNKFDLIGRLRSVKHYFFMDQEVKAWPWTVQLTAVQSTGPLINFRGPSSFRNIRGRSFRGDFHVHFMDIAEDELLKRSSSIAMEKLQSLLELALRMSVSASDPYHEDLICDLERTTLPTQLQNSITSGMGNNRILEPVVLDMGVTGLNLGNQGGTVNITGIETFTLDYKVRWPLSLVISRKGLTKHQLIFRSLFHLKHVERQLCMTWQAHQATRHLSFIGTAITWSYVLCQRMLHFLQSIEHYMTFEVLEPNWHSMEARINCAKSVDEIIQQHDMFLEKCLRECTLLSPSIFQKVESLKFICQRYALTTQWLIPSMNTPALEVVSKSSAGNSKPNLNVKAMQRLMHQPLQCWKADDESQFKSTLGRIDAEFRTELKELILLLSTHSQREPCFAHLAQALQGDEQAMPVYQN